MVTPSSNPSSATQMLNVELFADEGSKEIRKDSDDDPAMKTSISDSKDTSDEEPDTEAMGISSLTLSFLLLFSLLAIV